MNDFVGLDGFPCNFEESPTGQSLIQAVKGIPGASDAKEYQIETYALWLFCACESGKDDERPNNKRATERTSFSEMKKLDSTAEKLVDQIRSLHQPAYASIQNQGINLSDLAALLVELQDSMSGAWGDIEPAQDTRGRPPKIAAGRVTDEAALIYQMISDKEPKFKTDPVTNEVSGDWPTFLQSVFNTLGVRATSVESQIRAWKKNTDKNT